MISIPLPEKALELKVKVPYSSSSSSYNVFQSDMTAGAEKEAGGVRGDVLIVFQAVISPITFIITYFIAVYNDHVEADFPYISQTGTWPPESCIFGILLCFYSFSSILTVYIRWDLIRHHSNAASKTNHGSFFLGGVASMGVLIVANFQMTSQIIVHYFGAFLAFFIGFAYMVMQTFLTWKIPNIPGFFKLLFILRVGVTVLTALPVIGIAPFAYEAAANYRGNITFDEPGDGKWNRSLGGYELHVASTSLEWALAGLVSVYFLTFITEFRHLKFGMPRIHVTSGRGDIDNNTNGGIGNQGIVIGEQ